MSWVAAAVVAGSYYSSNAAKSAANTQAEAARYAADVQKQIFDIQSEQQRPYREAGYAALSDIANLKPYLTQRYGTEEFMKGIDPGYQFRLEQGQMANQRAANVGGGALSGNTLAGLQAYTQGQASQEFGNAFNRFQTERGNIYNTLSNIAGLGQTAVNQTTQAAGQYGTNVANLATGAAAAQAAGQVGSANAISGGLQTIGNYQYLNNLINRPPPTSYAVTPVSNVGAGANLAYMGGGQGLNLKID